MDQPDLGLPLSMYLDEASYTDYIAAYKQFIVDIALVVVSSWRLYSFSLCSIVHINNPPFLCFVSLSIDDNYTFESNRTS